MRLTKSNLCILAVLIAMCASSFAKAQFGRGGEFPTQDGKILDADPLLIVIPDSRDCVLAYSATTDNWDKIKLSSPLAKDEIPVIVGGGLAVVIHDGIAHGFSVQTGKWASIELQDAAQPARPVLSNGVAALRNADAAYAIGAKHGVWAKVMISKGSKMHPIVGGEMVRLVDEREIYVFSTESKRWSGMSLSNGDALSIK